MAHVEVERETAQKQFPGVQSPSVSKWKSGFAVQTQLQDKSLGLSSNQSTAPQTVTQLWKVVDLSHISR